MSYISIGQILTQRGVKMFCLMLRLLSRGTPLRVAPRHGLHKLASVQSASALPKRKFQGLLYPFSTLDPYLDRLALYIYNKPTCFCVSSSGFYIVYDLNRLETSVSQAEKQMHKNVQMEKWGRGPKRLGTVLV